MKKIEHTIAHTHGPILNVYCTAGYPTIDSLPQVIQALTAAGTHLVEVGMPYSDPLADGPVIQHSSSVALANGMHMQLLFDQLAGLHQTATQPLPPIILMGYLNPVLQYGFEAFCTQAARAGVSGLIIPDLPAHEYRREYGRYVQQAGLDFIYLVTPETSPERVKELDALSSGFLYAVSSSSTTGAAKNMVEVDAYLQRLKSYNLKNPVLVGFGIKDRAGFKTACTHARGAIIGSSYIAALARMKNLETETAAFVKNIMED